MCHLQQAAASQQDDELDMPAESRLTVRSVQRRVNQLTRELHALDETADMMRLVDERRARPSTCSSLKALSEIQENKERPGSVRGVQTGIQAFFSMSKPSPQKETDVIVLSDSDGDCLEVKALSPQKPDLGGDSSEVNFLSSQNRDLDGDSSEVEVLSPQNRDLDGDSSEVEVLSPQKRDLDGDHSEVEIVESPSNRDHSGKRKECESGSEAGSAEKKSKTT
jgi:hypothetical protein